MNLLGLVFVESFPFGYVVEEVHDGGGSGHDDEEAIGAFEPLEHLHDSGVSLFVHSSQQRHLHRHLAPTHHSPPLHT